VTFIKIRSRRGKFSNFDSVEQKNKFSPAVTKELSFLNLLRKEWLSKLQLILKSDTLGRYIKIRKKIILVVVYLNCRYLAWSDCGHKVRKIRYVSYFILFFR
jgi:hypothetical protein